MSKVESVVSNYFNGNLKDAGRRFSELTFEEQLRVYLALPETSWVEIAKLADEYVEPKS